MPYTPGGDAEWVGQATQVPALTAPEEEEYVPLGQSEHAAGPDAALNLPAGHIVHVPPFGPVIYTYESCAHTHTDTQTQTQTHT